VCVCVDVCVWWMQVSAGMEREGEGVRERGSDQTLVATGYMYLLWALCQ